MSEAFKQTISGVRDSLIPTSAKPSSHDDHKHDDKRDDKRDGKHAEKHVEKHVVETVEDKHDDKLDDYSKQFEGKTVFITGATRGIGAAIAEKFARLKANVAIGYNTHPLASKKAMELSKKYGIQAKAYHFDLCSLDSMKKAVKDVQTDFEKIDIFIANAAFLSMSSDSSDTLSTSADEDKKMLKCNLYGTLQSLKLIGQVFQDQYEDGYHKDTRAAVVIINSIAAQIGSVPVSTTYSITKAALLQLANTLAYEWRDFCRVNTVSPGLIETDMSEQIGDDIKDKAMERTPLGRVGKAEEVAACAVFFASSCASYCTGANLSVDGGYCTT